MGDTSFIFVHSPLVGPLTWSRVAEVLEGHGHRVTIPSLLGLKDSSPPHWRWCADRLIEAVEREKVPPVLVGHSGAGPYLPIVGLEATREIASYVFVEASVPARTGPTPIVPPEFLTSLEARAENGWLPRWSSWWDEETMRTLVPDEVMRRRLEDECPSLPLAYFHESIPVPHGWPDAPCSYLQFSAAYGPVAEDAESRGWQIRRLVGEHLHVVVEPRSVAEVIIDLARSSPAIRR